MEPPVQSTRASVAGPVGFSALAIWLGWAALEGGFPATRWGPLGIGLVLAFGLALVVGPPPSPLRWEILRRLAFTGLAVFVVIAFLSLLWAEVPGDAWVGADRILIYAVSFGALATWPWTPRGFGLLVGAFGLGVAILGAAVVVIVAAAVDPASFFQHGRLLEPTGYANASAALWTMALWPTLWLASTGGAPTIVRTASLAAAPLLVELAVLGQSRAWLAVMPFAAGLYVLAARDRLRSLLALAIVSAAALPALPSLLAVEQAQEAGLGAAVDDAAVAIAVTAAVAGLVGLLWARLEGRVVVGPLVRRVTVALAVVAVLGAIGTVSAWAAVRIGDDPGAWARGKWEEFTSSERGSGSGPRLVASVGTNRYDEWRVAWLEFVDHPVVGIGPDNYGTAYLLRRRDNSEVRFPPSIELNVLSQTGLLGAAAFTLFAGSAAALAVRRRRRLPVGLGGAVGAVLTSVGYWFAHGTVDWFWEIPALTAPALGLLGAASAVALSPARDEIDRGRRPVARAATTGAVAVAALAASVALAGPWLADAYAEAGTSVWRTRPELAEARLERAAQLNPLSARPFLLEASISLRRRELDEARTALARALEREPDSWYAYFLRALVEGYDENYTAAERAIVRARALNPVDSILGHAQRLIERRRTIEPERVTGLYLRRVNARAGRAVYPPWLALAPR